VLRIAEHFHASDLGRQRQGNEDNLFVRAPLFVVADGMGGAQAGEVASEMAVESFDAGLPGGEPAAGLVKVIEEANRRIHDRSRAEAKRAGMGTTVTAAYVGEQEVTIAHVGDSRAYLLRDGELIRLTRDHSLVGELVARGKLTEEQAETHPQRSVITRALGPEPDVQVDVQAYHARSGDVFMVCSDGLTSMVPESRVKPILEGAGSLEQAGRELIAAANDAGGRDNITVILFRVEEVDDRRGTDGDVLTTEYDTFAGESVEPRQGVTKPSPTATAAQEEEYRRHGTVALQSLAPSDPRAQEGGAAAPAREAPKRTMPLPDAPPTSPRRRRRLRRLRSPGAVLLVVAVVLPLLIGACLATRAVYFIGTDPDDGRTVAIFRGLPYELPFGIELYEHYYDSGVTLTDVPPARRESFTDHKLRSRDDAEDLVIALEKGEVE
jgi:PPM family protein phosphatase